MIVEKCILNIFGIDPWAIEYSASVGNLSGHSNKRATRRRDVSSTCQVRCYRHKGDNHGRKFEDGGEEHIDEGRCVHMRW